MRLDVIEASSLRDVQTWYLPELGWQLCTSGDRAFVESSTLALELVGAAKLVSGATGAREQRRAR